MDAVRRALRKAEEASLMSVLSDMEERGYSVEAQRRVLDAGLKSLERYSPPFSWELGE